MNFKKLLLLFLALLLPVVIFLFLKGFGSNQFDVPPLFQDVVDNPVGCDSTEYVFPYKINDSVLADISWRNSDSLTLVVYNDSTIGGGKISNQVDRIRTEFPKEKLNLINNTNQTFRNCAFLLKASDNVVLIDSKKRIRGQYNLNDLDEADRLIMEVKILLKLY
jgi:hypothetical protein